MKTTKVKCGYCGRVFERPTKEVKRSVKLGRKQYCCRGHATTAGNLTTPHGNRIPPPVGSNRDEFSQFRFFLSRGHGSMRKYGGALTLKDVKQRWDIQRGKCAYTGIDMVLPTSVCGWKTKAPPNAASLDRIDSSKGYTLDNVEFVCRFINLGKQAYAKQVVVDFITAIRNH